MKTNEQTFVTIEYLKFKIIVSKTHAIPKRNARTAKSMDFNQMEHEHLIRRRKMTSLFTDSYLKSKNGKTRIETELLSMK